MTYRIVVMVSGAGTLLQALLDARPVLGAQIVAVGSDAPDCLGIRRAATAGIDTILAPMPRLIKRGTPERLAWDAALSEQVAAYRPDLVVLAGFMKLFDQPFMTRFAGKIINSHPAMLPAFPGAHAVRDALAAGVSHTGCSIIWVDSGIDSGDVIAQRPVPILPDDDEETLHERIKVVERVLLVETVRSLAQAQLTPKEIHD